MKKFDDIDIRKYTVIEVHTQKPCVVCGDNTKYIDYCCECRVCSKECYEIITREITANNSLPLEKDNISKEVDITILQRPTEVAFTCVHCGEDIEIDYDEFKELTNSKLVDILYDYPRFNCPKCKEKLYIGEVSMD